jgi:glycosyltransferase involved in cell wall biosynthesis
MGDFPEALHMFTYDVGGVYVPTGRVKTTRQSGLVHHTHQLLRGIAEHHPRTRLTITRTGVAQPGVVGDLRTPEGLVVQLRGVATGFADHLRDTATGGKDPDRVRYFYEDRIGWDANPVWSSLARQYADQVLDTGVDDLLVQNVNPLVGILKAEETRRVSAGRAARLRITGVVHDAAQMRARFGYLARRLRRTRARVRLIAVSETIRQALLEAGVPAEAVRMVFNGMDTASFLHRLDQARQEGVFARVCRRDGVPPDRRVVLVSARRVPWKGHQDVIDAVHLLRSRGHLGEDVAVVFNGAGMVDTRTPRFEQDLREHIKRLGLGGVVFLLGELSPLEVVACYAGAHVAAHPSRDPEPFGYANIEAMLAGVPVIATAHGGPAEYIDHGRSGLLMPPRNPQAIARALHQVLACPDLHERLSCGGRAVARRFSLQAMFTAYAHTLNTGGPLDVKASA